MKPAFPVLRWLALAWLAAWVPVYWVWWGPQNFLALCDIAVILTCVGLWTGSRLLLSSQALSSLVVDSLWTLALVWRAATGVDLIGGMEYMFDAKYPLWLRLLSLFHMWLPPVLIYGTRKLGYDWRGLLLQMGIAAAALVVTLLSRPAVNLNVVYWDPFFRRAWGPPAVHIAVMWAGIVALFYLPTHFVLAKLFSKPRMHG